MNLAVPLALISVCKSGTCPVIKDVALTQHKYDKVHVHLYFPANFGIVIATITKPTETYFR